MPMQTGNLPLRSTLGVEEFRAERVHHLVDSHDRGSMQLHIFPDREPRCLDAIALCFGPTQALVPVAIHYASYDVGLAWL